MENALYVGGFEMEQKTAMKISMVSIVGNILLSLFKALAGIVANSGAMISDAIHSASDVFSTIVVIIGIRLSGKESDKEHPYGHERMECVAAILLATILAATGLFIGWSAVEKITVQDDSALAVPGILALVAAVVSIAVKEAMFWYTRAGAKRLIPGHLWRMHGTTAQMRCRRLAHLLVLQEPEWVIRFWMQLRALLSVFLSKKRQLTFSRMR